MDFFRVQIQTIENDGFDTQYFASEYNWSLSLVERARESRICAMLWLFFFLIQCLSFLMHFRGSFCLVVRWFVVDEFSQKPKISELRLLWAKWFAFIHWTFSSVVVRSAFLLALFAWASQKYAFIGKRLRNLLKYFVTRWYTFDKHPTQNIKSTNAKWKILFKFIISAMNVECCDGK